MYNINDLKLEDINNIINVVNTIIEKCSISTIEELKEDIDCILGYYGSDNLGYTIQKYDELSEIGDLLGYHAHDEIIEEIERLKGRNIMLYKVKAIVLNMGLGELTVERTIEANSKEEAEKLFIEKYLTIDILDVKEA